MRSRRAGLVLAGLLALAASPASALSLVFDDGSGLSGTADFTLVNPLTLKVVLTNTSSAPNLTSSPSNQLLTSLAFQLPNNTNILLGTAKISSGSRSIGFSKGSFGGGTHVGGEWGYGNGGTTGFGSLRNYVSALQAGTHKFGGLNLDGPSALAGPQGGLAAPGWISGGQGGIQSSATFHLVTSRPLWDLSFLQNGAMIEFGSDYRFLRPVRSGGPAGGGGTPPGPTIPEPNAALAFAVGLLVVGGATRRRAA